MESFTVWGFFQDGKYEKKETFTEKQIPEMFAYFESIKHKYHVIRAVDTCDSTVLKYEDGKQVFPVKGKDF